MSNHMWRMTQVHCAPTAPHWEHRHVYTGPKGLKVTVIAEGPSGCGKIVTLDAIGDLLASAPAWWARGENPQPQR